MPKFISPRDVNFFKGIARELVDDVVQSALVLFKINVNETKVNIYGESMNKSWYPGVEVFGLIAKEPESVTYEGFGEDTNQNVTFRLDRWMLEEKGIYPALLKNADSTIFIPMKGDFDSFNVSVSTGIVLYQAMKQRML